MRDMLKPVRRRAKMKRTRLKRRTPLKSKSSLGDWSKPRTPLRKRNHARLRKLQLRQFGTPERKRWYQSQPCDTCMALGEHDGLTRPKQSECSHVVTRGGCSGGGPDDVIPQCRKHHLELHEGVGRFEARYGVDLAERARVWTKRWAERS